MRVQYQSDGRLPDPTADLRWSDYQGAIHEIFNRNANDHPDRLCVIETKGPRSPERTFTYKHINEMSNQLAHFLLARGCMRGDVVTIYAHRGVDLVVSYMGALKAGGTVSVLDPSYPVDRQRSLLEVANPSFLVYMQRATAETGPVSEALTEFIARDLAIKAQVPALQVQDDGQLSGGLVQDQDCLEPYRQLRGQMPDVLVGPDSNPTLSFTSGSEGKPQGVLGRHYSLTYYIPWMQQKFELSKDDRFTMLSGIAHDPIQRDIFTPLYLGAQIVVPHRDSIAYEVLAEWMRENRITVTHLTPAMGQVLVGGATAQFPTLRHAFFVGDLLTKKDSRRLQELAPNARIVNMYGTTETSRKTPSPSTLRSALFLLSPGCKAGFADTQTGAVSFYEIPSKTEQPSYIDGLPDIIPVGQGMLNVQLLVVNLDDRSSLCKVGEQGEIFMRAGGLAEGYRGDDEPTKALNKAKFLTNWFVSTDAWLPEYDRMALSAPQAWMKYFKGPRDRVYRTGDLGRFRADGGVECTGRVDNQVKIRGFRIELGDIDAHLSQHPFIRANVTMVRRDKDEEPTVVSYIVPEAKRWLEQFPEPVNMHGQASIESMAAMLTKFRSLSEDCKRYLQTKVPEYAVPTMFIPLARLPLNPNGKIDRPALPFPTPGDLALLNRRGSQQSSAVEVFTETQQRLRTVWAEVLPKKWHRTLTPKSDFFEEGGHSILAQQMFFKVQKEWKDIDLPLSTVFSARTLEQFAAAIEQAQEPAGLRLDHTIQGGSQLSDEAYSVDAQELAAQLPISIPKVGNYVAGRRLTVLLTGATGFVGGYVLRTLLKTSPEIFVIAHIRCKDVVAGQSRLRQNMMVWESGWDGRIEILPGDISEPKLGLRDEQWERISQEVDLVIHSGARVHWMLPYSILRQDNVLSTVECINLCSQGRAKRFVYISSTLTLDTEHYVKLSQQSIAAGGHGVLETDDLAGSRKGLGTGYGQTKWASEFIAREAGRRGLVGAIVRSGYVSGDPRSGFSITDDFVVRLWKGCIQVRARPDIGSNAINLVPVTHVSRIVVAAGLFPPVEPLGVVHVTSHPPLRTNEWLGALEEYGYQTPKVVYKYWCSLLRKYVDDGGNTGAREHALLPLFHFVVGTSPYNWSSPGLDDTYAAKSLQAYEAVFGSDDGQGWRPSDVGVGIETMGRYMNFLVGTGFLPKPPSEVAREMPSCDFDFLTFEAEGGWGGRARR